MIQITGRREDLKIIKKIAKELELKVYEEENEGYYFAQKYSVRSTFRGKLVMNYSKRKIIKKRNRNQVSSNT